MTIREQINAIGEAFASGLQRILRGKFHALYVYGAAAFPDDVAMGDVDFHVILTGPLTDGEREQLYGLHDTLARDFPPLGGEMDGYYILLADARRTAPPQSEMWQRATDHSWALHRAHVLAGRHIVFHGPDPKGIYPAATWPELSHALDLELQYVAEHLEQYPDYCILQLCRLIYSHRTGEVVVSKAQASDWAYDALPAWRQHVALARKSYAGKATAVDRQFMLAQVATFYDFACTQIAQARTRRRQ